VVEVRERIELNWLAIPRALERSAKLGGETRRLADVPGNDFVIHDRDPLAGGDSKKAFRVGCTRKAGSRQWILRF
jgi:hypothetical protein